MREIYIPNVLRRDNIRKSPNGNTVTGIPYIVDFDLNDDKQLSVMLNYQLAIIVENILLYDRVYLDLIDFPYVIYMLYNEDKKSTLDIIRNSFLSFINCDEVVITTHKKNNGSYLLTYLGKDNSKIVNDEELANILFKTFRIGSEFSPELNRIIEDSKKIQLTNMREIGKYIVHLVDSELRAKTYAILGVGDEKGNHLINDENKGLYDVICQIVRDETIASLFNINTIYHNDIHKDIINLRLKYYNNYNDDFNEIMRINDIPDITKLYLEGHLKLKDILHLKKSKEFKAFQNWFFKEELENDDIIKAFYQATKDKSKLDTIPIKSIRFLTTSVIGALNPVAGTVAGVLDTFALDNLKKITPDIFFDSLSKKFQKSNISEDDIEVIPVRLNNKFHELKNYRNKQNNEIEIYQEILEIAKQIRESGDPIVRLNLLKKAEKFFNNYSSFNTFNAYMTCNIYYSEKGCTECIKVINDLENMFNFLKNSNNNMFLNCIRTAIVYVLINAMNFEMYDIAIPRVLHFLKNSYMKDIYIYHLNKIKGNINQRIYDKCIELLYVPNNL